MLKLSPVERILMALSGMLIAALVAMTVSAVYNDYSAQQACKAKGGHWVQVGTVLMKAQQFPDMGCDR